LILALALGILEYGWLANQKTAGVNAARNAARLAGATGVDMISDEQVIQELNASGNRALRDADRLVIYDGTQSANGAPPAACQTGSGGVARCNIYRVVDGVVYSSPPIALAWPLVERQPGTGSVGVWLSGRHDFVTGFFGPGINVRHFSVMPIQTRQVPPADQTGTNPDGGPKWIV